MKKNKKIGELASQLSEINVEKIEAQGKENKAYNDFLPMVWDTINKSKITLPNRDIFIEVYVETRAAIKTRVNHFRSRTTCPNPQFSQIVFHYKHISDQIDLLWSLPFQWQCEDIKNNLLDIDPEYKQLRDFVVDFYDGTLHQQAKILNKTHILKENIILTLDDDKKLEQKEIHKKKIKELNERKRIESIGRSH